MYIHCFGNGFDVNLIFASFGFDVNLIFASFGFVIDFGICIGFDIIWLKELLQIGKMIKLEKLKKKITYNMS